MTIRMQEAVDTVAAGLRVLPRIGVPITEPQIQERARNIVAALMGREWFSDAAQYAEKELTTAEV